MKERAAELRAQKQAATLADLEQAALDRIAEMPDAERAIAERLHALVKEHAPQLTPKTWYSMPAYVTGGAKGKVVLFFQAATKFESRYSTLGFQDAAQLDEGDLWPTSYAITAMTPEVEVRVVELIRRAARPTTET